MSQFTIYLDSFQVITPRSRESDTNTVSCAYSINNEQKDLKIARAGTWGSDCGIGKHTYLGGPFAIFRDIELADGDTLSVSYAILNSGQDDIEPVVNKVIGALLGKAVETIGGAIADVAFVGIWGLLTADCDGFVAMGTRTHTGAQLRDLTNGPPLQFADPNEGYRSPSGCGRNSDYVVNTRYIGPGTVLPHPPPGPGGGCFAPETLVLTINDMLVPIKSIEPGDVVMSENVKTGEIVPVIVSKVEKYLASDTLVLNLSNGETIETTPTQHFFHLEDRMPRSGSLLDKAMNSKGVRVATVEARKRTSVVYNLQLQKGKLSGDRYFVGKSRLKVFQKD